MKCEERGHQVNGSNGNWEAKRQEMGVLTLLGMGERGARNPRRQEEGGSALRYRSGDLCSRGGHHLPATEDMRSEPRELGLGPEDSSYAKMGSTHYPTATRSISKARPPHGLPLQGFQASGSSFFREPTSCRDHSPRCCPGSHVPTETAPSPGPSPLSSPRLRCGAEKTWALEGPSVGGGATSSSHWCQTIMPLCLGHLWTRLRSQSDLFSSPDHP